MEEEILEKANEFYEVLSDFKDSIEGSGNSNLYWETEEVQTALGSLIETMEQ